MATTQTFRSALNGFNREDVVRYLEYLNTKHQNQLNQLTGELESLRSRLEELQACPRQDPQLEEELEAVTRERDALRAQVEELQAQSQTEETESSGLTGIAVQELEAYRRAERIERTAREKAELVYHQASAILNEATAKVDSITDDITTKADEVMGQLTQLQLAVSSSKQALQDAVSLMNTIRPNI